MAVKPQQYFTLDNVYLRTGPQGERATYDSRGPNRKFVGSPKGVYLGFEPSALGSVLTLSPDSTRGLSVAKLPSDQDPAGLDVVADHAITLDFSAAVLGDFLPDGVQVYVVAHYAADAPTTAEVRARSKTLTATAATIGVVPAVFDLSSLPQERLEPASISIGVNVDGFGADTITDDGFGVLSSVGPALPGGGTIDYYTGEFTGTTAPLAASSSVLFARTRGVRRDEVLVCRVTGTPSSISVVGAPPVWGAPDDRDVPLAAGAADLDFGFMPPGGMEALAAAVDVLNEVAAARLDLQGVAHSTLKSRLDTDMGPAAMGTRLGKVVELLRSSTYSVAAGVTEVNVSGSMSLVEREYAPIRTFNGGGSETQEGVVTGPIDAARNVALVIDADSGERLLDNATSRNVVVGRMVQEADTTLSGVLTFTNALSVVSGDSNSAFTTELQVGDTIQGPDGLFYAVETITNDQFLLLRSAYRGVSAASANLLRRRFLLKFHKLTSGVETAHTLENAANVEAFFPVFMSLAEANFRNPLMFHRSGETPAVPDATTSVPGRVELASLVSPYAGAVHLQQRGVSVAGGPYHTINFTAAEARMSELAPGIVELTGIGPKGATGVGGSVGPTGPQGPQGPSYNRLTTIQVSGSETFLGPGPAGVTASLQVDFGFNIGFLSGGIAYIRDAGFFASFEYFEITDITIVSAQVGRIEGSGNSGNVSDQYVSLYLDAAGYA